MNKKHYIVLFFCALLPFLGYFLNPNIAFNDSYAYLGYICHNPSIPNSLETPLFLGIISFFPCSIIYLKVYELILYYITLIALAHFGEQAFNKEKGWFVSLFVAGLSPLLFLEAIKFENDQLGWCIAFIALAVTAFALNQQKLKKFSLLGLATLLFGLSFLFWKGTIVLFAMLGFSSIILFVFWLLPSTLIFFTSFIGYLQASFSSNMVAENQPGAAIIFLAFFVPFLLDIPKRWKVLGFVSFLVAVLIPKFALFCLPFVALGLVNMIDKVEKEDKYIKVRRHLPNFTLFCLIMCFLFAYIGFSAVPSSEQLQQDKEAIQLAQDLNINLYNDWDYGWHLTYLGYNTTYRAGYPNPDYNNLQKPYIALTTQDLNHLKCLTIKQVRQTKTIKCLETD